MGSPSPVVNQAKFSGCLASQNSQTSCSGNYTTEQLSNINNTQQPEAMLHTLCSAVLVASLVSGLPLSDNTLPVDTLDTSLENIINVDEKPDKLVELDLSSVPLGSQFAVDYFFPDRRKLETGHRIPLHLFPIETQNRYWRSGRTPRWRTPQRRSRRWPRRWPRRRYRRRNMLMLHHSDKLQLLPLDFHIQNCH